MATIPKASDKPVVVFVLGGPGSGKGTQCANIVRQYGFRHLSAGDLLRGAIASGSKDGAMIAEMIRLGQIVPAEVTVGLLRAAIEKAFAATGEEHRTHFLVDGFPRNWDNNRCWLEQMPAERVDTRFVLFFDCPEETMVQRCLNRGKTSGRTDDNADSIRMRLATFHKESLPVVEHYEKLGRVHHVDSTVAPDEVFVSVRKIFDKEFL